jgi:IS66 Orf2 like protein
MLHLNSSTVYYWYNGTADMRKGFDALCGIVQDQLHYNVLQGGVYIFVNRRRNQIKLLAFEGDGLAIYSCTYLILHCLALLLQILMLAAVFLQSAKVCVISNGQHVTHLKLPP